MKRLPATAPDGWRRFEAPRERFTVSFPAAPETVTGGDGIGYHAASNDAVFLVHAGAPAIGDDASQVLADLAPSFANEFVGRIISDVRSTRNGASERTLVVVAGGTVLHHRVVVLGNRSWVLTAGARGGARPADEDVQTFFDSFRPVEE